MKHTLTGFCAALALAALLIGGCGAPEPAGQLPPAPAAVAPTAPPRPAEAPAEDLYVRDDDGDGGGRLAILSSAGGAEARELPLGAISPDWSTLYTVAAVTAYGPPKTFVRAIDLKTGKPARETTIEGAFELPSVSLDELPGGLSPNGRWLVLRKAPGQAASARDQFVVFDTAFALPPRRVDLDVDGLYAFDGINNAGSALYLIQYLASPSTPLAKYQVRYYNLALGALDPQVVVAKGDEQVMAGTHHTSLASPNGVWRYSLYMNNQHGPFIHALDLDDQVAICIDLPKTGKDDEGKQLFWALAASPDGRTIYAANGALGLVSELDISDGGFPQLRRTAELPPAPAASGGPLDALAALFAAPVAAAKPEHGGALGAAALSADGRTLFALGERGLLAIDTRDLSLRGRYLPDTALSGVALSPAGEWLYVVGAENGQILQIDQSSGKLIGEVVGARRPWSVLRVEAQK